MNCSTSTLEHFKYFLAGLRLASAMRPTPWDRSGFQPALPDLPLAATRGYTIR